jgi:predicted nucleic acid-binding protein
LSSQSESLGAIARQYDLVRHTRALRRRPDAELPFDVNAAPALALLLDTTVYLDRSFGRLPRNLRTLIAARQHLVYNCGVVCAELAIGIGLLSPTDPRTRGAVEAIQAHLEQMAVEKTVAPTASAWTEAAVLAGILARIQGFALPKQNLTPEQSCCQQGRRRELLLDALLYLTAIEQKMLLLSGNIRHLDFLLQLRPSDNVLLYRTE